MPHGTGRINSETYGKVTIPDPLLKNQQEFQEECLVLKQMRHTSERGTLEDCAHHMAMKPAPITV